MNSLDIKIETWLGTTQVFELAGYRQEYISANEIRELLGYTPSHQQGSFCLRFSNRPSVGSKRHEVMATKFEHAATTMPYMVMFGEHLLSSKLAEIVYNGYIEQNPTYRLKRIIYVSTS